MSAILNLAMDEIEFHFRKVSEKELVIADKYQDTLNRTRKAVLHTLDPKDPEYITLLEELQRLLAKKNIEELTADDGYGNMPTKLIDVQFYLQQISQVIEKIGYMQAKQNDLTIFVEKDPAAIAVAEGEFIPESLSYRLISYNHYSMKGNLAEKKTTLLDLANLLEPQRTKNCLKWKK